MVRRVRSQIGVIALVGWLVDARGWDTTHTHATNARTHARAHARARNAPSGARMLAESSPVRALTRTATRCLLRTWVY